MERAVSRPRWPLLFVFLLTSCRPFQEVNDTVSRPSSPCCTSSSLFLSTFPGSQTQLSQGPLALVVRFPDCFLSTVSGCQTLQCQGPVGSLLYVFLLISCRPFSGSQTLQSQGPVVLVVRFPAYFLSTVSGSETLQSQGPVVLVSRFPACFLSTVSGSLKGR